MVQTVQDTPSCSLVQSERLLLALMRGSPQSIFSLVLAQTRTCGVVGSSVPGFIMLML